MMKKLHELLYVTSIIVAVGVGMTQVGKIGNEVKGQKDCTIKLKRLNCSSINKICTDPVIANDGSGNEAYLDGLTTNCPNNDTCAVFNVQNYGTDGCAG